jgi:phage-related protein
MKWNGTDISTKGLVALTQPRIQAPEMDVEVYKIEGSDKTEVVEKGRLPYELEVQMMCANPAHLDAALVFLQGSGALISDDVTDKYWNAQIIKKVEFERLAKGPTIRVADVRFFVKDPYRYKVSETNTTLSSPGNVTNAGTVDSLPLIKITGSGTVVITIGGRSFTYVFGAEPHVFIDSFIQEAYYSTTLKNANMTGAFPYLTPGVNAVSWTGTVTELVITPRSRYL